MVCPATWLRTNTPVLFCKPIAYLGAADADDVGSTTLPSTVTKSPLPRGSAAGTELLDPADRLRPRPIAAVPLVILM